MSMTWEKLPGATRSVVGTSTTLNESAPSTDSNAGIDLSGVDSICIAIDAPTGQTFDGTGELHIYRQMKYTKIWRLVDEFEIDMADAAGKTSHPFAPIEVHHKAGRMAVIPVSVGVSGGTALTITIEASYGRGGDGQ